MNAIILLKLAALTHLGLIAAGLLMPRVTGLWGETHRLSPFGQGLFRTYYCFIGLCLVSCGLASWFLAKDLASGTVLARAICGFLTAFWALRLVAAAFLLDVKPYLKNGWWKLGYHATNVVFSCLPFIYAYVAFRA